MSQCVTFNIPSAPDGLNQAEELLNLEIFERDLASLAVVSFEILEDGSVRRSALNEK